MNYEYLNSSIERENVILPQSDKINPFLLENNTAEILKGIEFLATEEKFLYIHGFMGTGKRQFVNYITEFVNENVIKLEYYCKQSTVSDDILLAFTDSIDNLTISKAINLNAKITTLGVKFKQQISSIKKPFLIVLHSLDDVSESNFQHIKEMLLSVLKEDNIKLIISTRAMKPSLLGDVSEDKKIFLKAFSKEVFRKFLNSNQIDISDSTLEDFYKYTRGYYYYLALTVKIIQAMKINLNEFLLKYNQSEMSFDSFLGLTYVNLVPTTIRNFFWFLRTIRHGLSLNALAILELYDEFSIEYLKTNLMIFQVGEILYVQDYFLQNIDILIPKKTEIKLHKYIIGIYENQLKLSLKDRSIMISRQAMRAEIEYHNNCISKLENNTIEAKEHESLLAVSDNRVSNASENKNESVSDLIVKAKKLFEEKKYTEAIECYRKILDLADIDLTTLVEVRLNLANLYKKINDYPLALYFYELVETYYRQYNEIINLNYLYYDMTDILFKMYKNERAIETIKKVIYSVDTPQSLFVSSCTLLGNIFVEMNNPEEAYSYYKKALESLDENVEDEILADLYFKFALTNDDKGNINEAFDYYNKCLSILNKNPYKSLAYSNLASCYLENGNYADAKTCFRKAYELEKESNNYDGIYYNAIHLAKILMQERNSEAFELLSEAKRSAEFINEEYYILESTILLGDFYYSNPKNYKDALREYFKAQALAERISGEVDSIKIKSRIKDMKIRMKQEDFEEIESKYAK